MCVYARMCVKRRLFIESQREPAANTRFDLLLFKSRVKLMRCLSFLCVSGCVQHTPSELHNHST